MLTLCIHKAYVSLLPFFMCHVLVEAYCFSYSGVLHSNAFLKWEVVEELIEVLGCFFLKIFMIVTVPIWATFYRLYKQDRPNLKE